MKYSIIFSLICIIALPTSIIAHLPSGTQPTQQKLNVFRRTIAKGIYFYEQYKKYRTHQFSPEEQERFEKELRSLRNKALVAGCTFVALPPAIIYGHYLLKNARGKK